MADIQTAQVNLLEGLGLTIRANQVAVQVAYYSIAIRVRLVLAGWRLPFEFDIKFASISGAFQL